MNPRRRLDRHFVFNGDEGIPLVGEHMPESKEDIWRELTRLRHEVWGLRTELRHPAGPKIIDFDRAAREKAILEELVKLRKTLEKSKAEERPPREIKGDVLTEFKRFCEVDLHLSDITVRGHVRQIKRLLKSVGKSPQEIAEDDVRDYLAGFKNASTSTYANVLKSLRVFFRDFMRTDITNGFKFPKHALAPKAVPSKEQLKKFYRALKRPRDRALFLLYATTGLRRDEVLALTLENIDLEKRMILSPVESTRTKLRWVAFFNEEAAEALKAYLAKRGDLKKGERLFPRGGYANLIFKRASRESGVDISPQILRDWFCSEMGELGVADRYVDAFCGRVPRSVLARHYTDFSPERLKRVYDNANLRVLS